ncbi:MAG TPA: ABC transporter permease [Chthonomonadaceae bacterium]|nr:ABC transporter permease [Chthonomonadaceae bacterium]
MAEVTLAKPSLSPTAEAWRRLQRNPVAVVCGTFIVGLVLVALLANLLKPQGYDTPDFLHRLAAGSAAHPLGTDQEGRDVLSRIVYGARISLGVATVIVSIEIAIGLTLGLIAGYYGGAIDSALMRVTDVMFSFPDILLAILLVAVVQPGPGKALAPQVSLITLFVALGLVYWPGLARLARGQAMALRNREYIEAARAMGVRDRAILLRHLLPNTLSPIIVQVTQDIAQVMLAEATLSFLGLGVQPPFPSWGRMIQDALPFKEAHPILLLAPTVALAATVMAFNFFGDALRDALDPRLRE